MIRHSRVALATILATLATIPTPSQADELAAQSATLRGRTENVQLLPESVTVLSSDQLGATYRSDLHDLEGFVPGLVIDSLAGAPDGAATYLRGIGANDANMGLFPAVALTVDGVYVGSPAGQDASLFDVQTIEVDRGPQGIWTAPPAPGGSINLSRSRPTGVLSARTHLTLGDFQRRRFDAVINFPIIDALAGKVTFDWRRGGKNEVRNIYLGRSEDEEQLTAESVSLLWNPASWTVQYTYDHGSDDSDVPALLNLSTSSDLVCAASSANCAFGSTGTVPETGTYRATSQDFSNLRKFKSSQNALHLDFDRNGVHFKSITAIRTTGESFNQDLDGTFADFLSTVQRRDYRQVSQEFGVYGKHGDNVAWAFGAYLLNTHYDLRRWDHYALDAIASDGAILPVVPNDVRVIDANQGTRYHSLFAHVSAILNPWWTADFGLKSNSVSIHFNDTFSSPETTSGPASAPTQLKRFYGRDDFSGTAGLSYQIADNAMSYLRYNRAIRPGGIDNTANSVNAAQPFDSQRAISWELGLKSEWFDKQLRFNYVVYREDYKGQLQRYTEVVDSGRVESVLKNTSNLRVFGHEAEITAAPIESLLLKASLSHSNSDYIDYRIPDLSGASAYVDNGDLIPPMSPPDQYAFSAQYKFPYWEGDVTVYGAYRFTTSYWSDPTLPSGHVNTFAILDFSIDYDWQDWTFRFFSHNFNDRRYLTSASRVTEAQLASLLPGTTVDKGIATTAQYNEPRFSGIQVSYNFSRHAGP